MLREKEEEVSDMKQDLAYVKVKLYSTITKLLANIDTREKLQRIFTENFTKENMINLHICIFSRLQMQQLRF